VQPLQCRLRREKWHACLPQLALRAFPSWHCGRQQYGATSQPFRQLKLISSSEHWKRLNHSFVCRNHQHGTYARRHRCVRSTAELGLSLSHSCLSEKPSPRLCLSYPTSATKAHGGLAFQLRSWPFGSSAVSDSAHHCLLQEFTVTHCQDLGCLSPSP
jgi:hypothetical protein